MFLCHTLLLLILLVLWKSLIFFWSERFKRTPEKLIKEIVFATGISKWFYQTTFQGFAKATKHFKETFEISNWTFLGESRFLRDNHLMIYVIKLTRSSQTFIFTLLCGASKGFMNALKAFIKPFEAPQRSENKSLT